MAKLFKRGSEQNSSNAAVSSIPVSPADSALVIDLPEGQKLVLGKMDEGTVIEVATWRGTGRPDSRTNRLMLGVSFGGTAQSPNQEQEVKIENLTAIEKFQFVAKRFTLKALDLAGSQVARIKSRLRDRSFTLKSIKTKSLPKKLDAPFENSGDNEEFDIDEWLASIKKNSRVDRLSTSEDFGMSHPESAGKVGNPGDRSKKANKQRLSSSKRGARTSSHKKGKKRT